MENNKLEELRSEIESVRDEINTYIEYPEIFSEELVASSKKIDILINKYMSLNK